MMFGSRVGSRFGQVKFGVAKNRRFLNSKFNSRKAQLKFGETIGVIFIVYIVIVVGFVWYNNVNSKDILEQIEKQAKESAFEKFNFVLKLNLIHKSELGYLDQEFDRTSLMALKNFSGVRGENEFLRRKLGSSQVTFFLYDVDLNLVDNITVYNNTPERDFIISPFRTVLPIYDGVNEVSYVGLVEVLDFRVVQ